VRSSAASVLIAEASGSSPPGRGPVVEPVFESMGATYRTPAPIQGGTTDLWITHRVLRFVRLTASRTKGMHMTDEAAGDQLQSFDSNAMPWGELYIDQLKLGVPLKAFVSDPDTGMSVQMVRYAAGFTNPWHRHNCATVSMCSRAP
jgi:hypothetical protein